MTYLYFYLVTRVLAFLFLALYLRVATLSRNFRDTTTTFFLMFLIPVFSELPLILILFAILANETLDFIENNIQYPTNWFYKILNGKPHDA